MSKCFNFICKTVRYVLIYILLTCISNADTSLEEGLASITEKYAVKEMELLNWYASSIERTNSNSMNLLLLNGEEYEYEENRIENLKKQKSDLNIENEQKTFVKKGELRPINKESPRIDTYYDSYPNEFAIVCRGLIKDGQITINGSKEPIVLVTASSFEFLSSSEAIYTYVTGPLFKDKRFDKKYSGERNAIFQTKLKLKNTIDEFQFYLNNEITYKINRNNGEVWSKFRNNILFESNECYESNRFAIELKMDKYKELFNLQEQIVDSINKGIRNTVESKIDKINAEISKKLQIIEKLENKQAIINDENELSIKMLKKSYEAKLDELKNNEEQEKYNLWYNSPEQVAKRENERKKRAERESNYDALDGMSNSQVDNALDRVSYAKSCFLLNPDPNLNSIYTEMISMLREYGLSGLNYNTNATYLNVAEARAEQLISLLGC